MTTRDGPADTELYLALHAEDTGHYWTTYPPRLEEALRETGRCDRETARSRELPWFEFCGTPLPCPDHAVKA